MESVSKIRRWVLVEERSIRSVARMTGLSRNTIKKYLKDNSPPSYHRQAPTVRHKLCNGFDLRLQELFEQDLKRPRRERRTAQKLYEQLVVEGYTGSYSPVLRFVRDLKRAGAGSGEAFITLHIVAGDALQFDWSEERVVLAVSNRRSRLPISACVTAANLLWWPISAKLRRWCWMRSRGRWRSMAACRAG